MTKETYRLEYETRHGWRTMYDRNGNYLIDLKSLEAAKKEREKAIKRHKPYGRDYTYRIVKVTEEVVEEKTSSIDHRDAHAARLARFMRGVR